MGAALQHMVAYASTFFPSFSPFSLLLSFSTPLCILLLSFSLFSVPLPSFSPSPYASFLLFPSYPNIM